MSLALTPLPSDSLELRVVIGSCIIGKTERRVMGGPGHGMGSWVVVNSEVKPALSGSVTSDTPSYLSFLFLITAKKKKAPLLLFCTKKQ
jgi:hypothetical protein